MTLGPRLSEYDAFQVLMESIRRAEEAARDLAHHRPDQPWPDVAVRLNAFRVLMDSIVTDGKVLKSQ